MYFQVTKEILKITFRTKKYKLEEVVREGTL